MCIYEAGNDSCVDQLEGTSYFLKIDLRSGYHQFCVRDEDIPKMDYQTKYGHYEFLVMSFGLTNAPTTFMDLMNRVFKYYLDSFVIFFIDDILVYSKSENDHMRHLRIVLNVLKEPQLFSKYSSCKLLLISVALLDHIVSSKGIEADPKKTNTFKNLPRPLTPLDIRGFLVLLRVL